VATRSRKKASGRRGASRKTSQGAPAFAWFLGGVLAGLCLAAILFARGYLPERPGGTPEAAPAQAEVSEPALIEDSPTAEPEDTGDRRFDFFTVLPEMEVIVPDRELSGRAGPGGAEADGDALAAYVLQVGSFRQAGDAEAMKARLALLGIQASVQVVTVNAETWHRVRIGPVQGARRADELRRQLLDQNYPALVLKDSS
jgi:cell division protein FtsN